MNNEHEIENQSNHNREFDIEMDSEEFLKDQIRHKKEIGKELLQLIIDMIYEKYPDMKGVEPIIRDESVIAVTDNILTRLNELKTTENDINELDKAWKSLLFKKKIRIDNVNMMRVINAIINRRGDLRRIDETIG